MLFELLNPLDTYTLKASSLEVALAVCGLIGHGAYGVQPLDDNGGKSGSAVLLDLHQDLDAQFEELTGIEVDRVWDRHAEMADALESVLIGDRGEFERLENDLPTQKARMALWFGWHARHKSGKIDLAGIALPYALAFRGMATNRERPFLNQEKELHGYAF